MEDGTILIGKKPSMVYVTAAVLQAKKSNKIVIKARGMFISKAVDVAEITRRRFMKDLKVSKIAVGTEEMPPREGENTPRNVSTVEITLTRE